jgi:hypothetical protein
MDSKWKRIESLDGMLSQQAEKLSNCTFAIYDLDKRLASLEKRFTDDLCRACLVSPQLGASKGQNESASIHNCAIVQSAAQQHPEDLDIPERMECSSKLGSVFGGLSETSRTSSSLDHAISADSRKSIENNPELGSRKTKEWVISGDMANTSGHSLDTKYGVVLDSNEHMLLLEVAAMPQACSKTSDGCSDIFGGGSLPDCRCGGDECCRVGDNQEALSSDAITFEISSCVMEQALISIIHLSREASSQAAHQEMEGDRHNRKASIDLDRAEKLNMLLFADFLQVKRGF